MTRDELLARFQSIEWSDIEFKEAAWAAPKDALETVSAFANTAGGYLVFGVKQANGTFVIMGVTDTDAVQNTFLSWVRDQNKISVFLPIDGTAHTLAEGADYDSAIRWADRLTVEDNLIKAWQAIVEFYFRHSERPFAMDAATLRRDDDPPDYISFREAAINLLIHQDFGDTTRVPVIRYFRDQTEFFNPGDTFASCEQLLDPGDKEVRNPSIVNAFRRIGLSDQGGTGVRAIFDGWRKLGYLPPEIENHKAEKSFRLRLRREKLITEAQVLAQANLGAHLSAQEADVFAYLTRKGQIDLTDVKALTGLSGAEARQLVQRLAVQALLVAEDEGDNLFGLAEHLRPRFLTKATDPPTENQSVAVGSSDEEHTDQATDQADGGAGELDRSLDRLSDVQRKFIGFADVPRSMAELMAHAGFRHRPHFVTTHIEPLLAGGVLRLTLPEKPRSPNQRYVLTEAGVKLKLLHEQAADPTEEDNGH